MMKMTAQIHTGYRELKVDMGRPMPISITMRSGEENPVAWYAPYPSFEPVKMNGFVGSVAQGGSVNTNDISFNPHGNGTHTECIGHLTKETHSLDQYMQEYFHLAQVHSVSFEELDEDESSYRKKGDRIIMPSSFEGLEIAPDVKALIIRTLPNPEEKRTRRYTGNNPPYVDAEVMQWARVRGIEHLLIDLPSVDREEDGGRMLAHRAFWYNDEKARMHATITELIFVPDSIVDGLYMLNIMVAPFANDASPSKPVLYPILL
jgi:arylformamidase